MSKSVFGNLSIIYLYTLMHFRHTLVKENKNYFTYFRFTEIL